MMVPLAPPAVAPLLIFMPDWETLARLAYTWSNPLDLDACLALTSLRWFCGTTDKPNPACFWDSNQETVAVILRPKSPNQSCWFWGPNRETLHHLSFEVKPRETVATNFEAKLEKTTATDFKAKPEKTVATGFEVKPLETVATGFKAKPVKTVTAGFEAKPLETVRVVLRSNHSQTVSIGFEAQTDEKQSEWFRGQTTHKLSTLLLRLNQETCASRLHVYGADRTQRHLISRLPDHRVPDLCDHLRSSTTCLLLLPRSLSLYAMPHLLSAHHETSKHDYPNETKVKEK
jgi:hypothetical protein